MGPLWDSAWDWSHYHGAVFGACAEYMLFRLFEHDGPAGEEAEHVAVVEARGTGWREAGATNGTVWVSTKWQHGARPEYNPSGIGGGGSTRAAAGTTTSSTAAKKAALVALAKEAAERAAPSRPRYTLPG